MESEMQKSVFEEEDEEDECQEAQEDVEDVEEEKEISDSFLTKVSGEKSHKLTNPLEIR